MTAPEPLTPFTQPALSPHVGSIAVAYEAMALCPYPGLDAFTEEYRRFFVGRKRDTELLVSNLYAAPLTILYGASGVGKSSVLLAGVVPRVKDAGDAIIVVHRTWQSESLVKSLGTRVVEAVEEKIGKKTGVDGALPLDEVIEALGPFWDDPFLIVFDQFEEYFLYPLDRTSPDSFDAAFARAVNRRDLDVHFMISLREDSLSGLDRFRHRIPTLLSNLYRLEFLTRDEIKRAILEPLATLRQLYPNAKVPNSADNTLADVIVSDQVAFEQGGEGGATTQSIDRFVTPFLQLVMRRLWEEEARAGSTVLQTSTFERLGRATGVVRLFIKDTLGALSPDEQRIAANVLRYLVTPSGAKVALGVGDLAGYITTPDSELRKLALKLSGHEQRILRAVQHPTGRPELARFEIYHDALARPLLDWRVAFERRQAERDAMETARREAAERDRARRHKLMVRARNLGVGAGALLAVFIGWRSMQAMSGRSTARVLAAHAAERIDQNRGLALLLALEALKRDSTSFEADEVLRRALFEAGEVAQERLGADPDALLLSPDGAWLMARSSDDTTHILDTSSLSDTLNIWTRDAHIVDARFTPDSKWLFVGQDNGTVRLFDLIKGKEAGEIAKACDGSARSVAATANGAALFVICDDGSVRGWRGIGAREFSTIVEPNEGGLVFRTSPDGRRIYLFADSDLPRPLDTEGMRMLDPVGNIDFTPNEILFTSDGRLVGVHWGAPRLEVFGGEGRARAWSLKCAPSALDVARKSGAVVYGCEDGAMSLANLDEVFSKPQREEMDKLDRDVRKSSGATIGFNLTERRLTGHVGSVSATEVSDDGRMAFSIGPDGAIVWDLTTQRPLRAIRPASGAFTRGVFLRDNAHLVTVTSDGVVQLWSLEAARRTFAAPASNYLGAVLAPKDAKYLASANMMEGVQLWPTDGSGDAWKVGVAGLLGALPAFAPDGARLAAMWGDGEVTEFDVEQRTKTWESAEHTITENERQRGTRKGGESDASNARLTTYAPERSLVQYSADGKTLMSANFLRSEESRSGVKFNLRVRLYDVGTGALKRELPVVNDVDRVALSPDARVVAVALKSGDLRFIDVTTGRTWMSSSVPGMRWNNMAYVNDGSLIASVGGTLTVFDPFKATSGEARSHSRSLTTQLASISALSVSHVNTLLAVGDTVGNLEVWDFKKGSRVCSIPAAHSSRITTIDFAPSGTIIASGADDRAVAVSSVGDALGCRFLYRILPNEQRVERVAFKQSKPPFLAVMNSGGLARIYDRSLWAPRDSLIALAAKRLGSRKLSAAERREYKLPER